MAHFNKKQANNQHGKGKHPFKKKNVATINCFNSNAKGHFARDYPKPNKVSSYTKVSEFCVASFVFLIKLYPLWIINLGVMDHAMKNRETLIEF